MLAVGASVMLAAAATILSTTVLREYGWGLFVGVPFSMGFLSALIHGVRQPRRLAESVVVAVAFVGIGGGLLLGLAFEGAIWLVMAAPLAFALAGIEAVARHALHA